MLDRGAKSREKVQVFISEDDYAVTTPYSYSLYRILLKWLRRKKQHKTKGKWLNWLSKVRDEASGLTGCQKYAMKDRALGFGH